MTAVGALRALAGGAHGTVLGACRLESGGIESFGSEAIAAAFYRAPLGLEDAVLIECADGIALFASGEAVFADVFGDHIGRLWRIGQARPGTPEPAMRVAFDPDLAQARAAVLFAPRDHPSLSVDAAARIEDAGRTIIGDPAQFRARAFVVRAFGDRRSGAALLAVHALAAGRTRTPSLTMAAAYWEDDSVRLVRDAAAAPAGHIGMVE